MDHETDGGSVPAAVPDVVDLRRRVQALDVATVAEIEAAWNELRPFRQAALPLMRAAFPAFRRWQGRATLAYYSVFDARTHDDAFEIGVLACSDRSKAVRHRGCQVLAYSLRRDGLPVLRRLRAHEDMTTRTEAEFAIVAIEEQDHHLYIDRFRSGRVFWRVNPGD